MANSNRNGNRRRRLECGPKVKSEIEKKMELLFSEHFYFESNWPRMAAHIGAHKKDLGTRIGDPKNAQKDKDKRELRKVQDVEAKLAKMKAQLDGLERKKTEWDAQTEPMDAAIEQWTRRVAKLRQMKDLCLLVRELLEKMKAGEEDENLVAFVRAHSRSSAAHTSNGELAAQVEALRAGYQKAMGLWIQIGSGLEVFE